MANKPSLQRARFAAIESLLRWEGEVGNARLRTLFDLQSVQASRLIAAFRNEYPGAVKADTRAKRFIPSESFSPRSADPSLAFYLTTLAQACGDAYFAIEDARIDLTSVHPKIFTAVRNACVHGMGLQTRYESMNHPNGVDRLVYPSTMVRVGRRWHVRAWCCERQAYRDFNLGRIRSAKIAGGSRPRLPADVMWKKQVTITLRAHRVLDEERQGVIRREYFAGDRTRDIDTRACHVAYVIEDLQAAMDVQRQRPPQYQIEVMNARQLKPYLFGKPVES